MPSNYLHRLLYVAIVTCAISGISAFQPGSKVYSGRGPSKLSGEAGEKYSAGHVIDSVHDPCPSHALTRRLIFRTVLQGIVALPSASIVLGNPDSTLAAAAPSPAELKKLQLGHARVQYLLSNWDVLTQTCNNRAMSSTELKQVVRTEGGGGGFCEKTPLVVQEYLGYKSIEDPLFKADKLMLKAVPLVDESVMDAADYVDLVERYREKADQTSLMAYTSSWGEANPNGGKEVVDEYLERTKDEVKETERLLRSVLSALNLEVLAPSDKKA